MFTVAANESNKEEHTAYETLDFTRLPKLRCCGSEAEKKPDRRRKRRLCRWKQFTVSESLLSMNIS